MSKDETTNTNKRLPLSSDIVFKKVFAKEENLDLLKSLLEAILKIEIRKIELKNSEIIRDSKNGKSGVLDVKAEINDNSVIDIEMQVENEYNMEHRSAFYMVNTASNEIKKGQIYVNLKKTIVMQG